MTDHAHSATALFEQLKSIAQPPSEEVFIAVEQRQTELTPMLLDEIATLAEHPHQIEILGQEYIRHVVSIFILAYLRKQAAYPLVIKLISHPGDKIVNLTGEVFTEALGRILASVYDGNLQPIKSVVENASLNPWIRSGALDAFMVLWKEGQLERAEVIAYLKELMEGKLEHIAGYVWDSIALIAYDLHPRELEELLRQAISKQLIAPMVLNAKSLKICLKNDLNETIKNKDKVVDGYIKEPIKELTWWLYPDTDVLDKGMEYAAVSVPIADKKVTPGERSTPMGWRNNNVTPTTKKVGRNEPCPCGSGKKYKKCCGLH
ncbi:MAG: DUF1186 domain-containing protein [Gammaproteobacteria bacterium]|nr:DUF1186 domain-containing protein [Gammaproteobacteria bacterium]